FESNIAPKGSTASDRGLSLSIGRNGVVLSVGDQLIDLLGKKPKNLRDFIEWPVPTSSGTCRIRSRAGLKPYFCLLKEVSIGRSEMYFFELPGERDRADDLIGLLPIPILQINDQGEVLAQNVPARNFLENVDPIGRRFHEVFEGVGRPLNGWVTAVLNDDEDRASHFARLTVGGQEKFVQINLCKVNLAGHSRFLAVLNDATDLKTLEAQFVQSQKMQAIGQLAGGVAHDFNNLLTAISGHCDLLLLHHGESDTDYADLDQIRQNSNRAASLVNQLLAFSRKQTLQPQAIDLEQTLSDHTHLLNRLVGEKTRLALHHGPNMKMINADKRQFEQVIMNLVVNARDAMNGTGQIRISTDMIRYQKTEKRSRAKVPAGNYCQITVSDEGCGIEPDKVQRIFEPFYTSKKTGEGTGLGLSTVYGIVKQTGGFIFVDSVPGVGTTFELLFPAAINAPRQVAEIIDAGSHVTDSAKADGVVLLVEDEAPVRAFASRALKLKGFSVLEAACAEEALELLTDETLTVDIFVTDVVMPGIDGPTWVVEALKHRPNTKVVFVSGYAENRCDELHDNIPNSIFLPKPFSLNQLTTTVARLH
ncbi:MAG: ATP-binding protein, partial [Paracoccaceae bacterium]|nr:ATP-binding protein [Paracoccaceae bacterium]